MSQQQLRFRLSAVLAAFVLLLAGCGDDDGSLTDASDDSSSQGTDSGDGETTDSTPEDPSPLEWDDLTMAMEEMVSEDGIAQMVTVTIDGETAFSTSQEMAPDSTVVAIAVNPELVGLDMATYGDLVEQFADDEGLLYSGSFANRQRAGLSGFLLVTQGFPVTMDDFSQPRYLEDDTAGEQIETIPATYGDAWEDDGLAPNEIPPEFIVLTFEGMEDLDGTSTRKYTLTIDEDAVDDAGESFDDSGYPVTIWVDDSNTLRQVRSGVIESEGAEYQMQLQVLDLDGSPMELPDDARSFTVQELEYIATPPPATLPAEHQQLFDFSTALETAVDDFTENSPFSDL